MTTTTGEDDDDADWWCFPKTDRWPGDPDCLWRSHSRSVVRAVCLYHQLLVTQVYQWMCFDLYFSFHKFFSHWPCSKTILQWILSGTHTKGVFLYDKCGSLPFCTNELGWEIYWASGMMPVLQHVKSIMANKGGPFTPGTTLLTLFYKHHQHQNQQKHFYCWYTNNHHGRSVKGKDKPKARTRPRCEEKLELEQSVRKNSNSTKVSGKARTRSKCEEKLKLQQSVRKSWNSSKVWGKVRERPCRRLTQNFATGGIVGHTHVEDDDDVDSGVDDDVKILTLIKAENSILYLFHQMVVTRGPASEISRCWKLASAKTCMQIMLQIFWRWSL